MVRFGIIGLGKIAHKFAEDLIYVDGCTLQAVGSRSLHKAKDFGTIYKSVQHYGSYEEVARDPNVDVVYIATPHVFHFENTMLCLKACKAVICEKPFAMNLKQVEKMIFTAKEHHVFCMQALWTRFIPATNKVLELLELKTIGDIHKLTANFGYKATTNPSSRLIAKELGGGSLLDIGIYPIFLSQLFLGKPETINAKAQMMVNGVDETCSITMFFNNGATAQLTSTFLEQTSNEAVLYGSKGSITMHAPFHHTEFLTVEINGEQPYQIKTPLINNGYTHEIEEVRNCLINGQLESDQMSHLNSLDLMKTMDLVRAQINLEY
jgi:predicted dehydrogenase